MEDWEKLKTEKKILVTKALLPSFEDFVNTIKPLWDSAWLTNMGELHNELVKALKTYLMVENLSLFTNGHLSLELLLQAMKLKGEVITTPFTFASTTHAITRNNLIPVFCDINYSDYTIDASKIEYLITDRTCAILPVHVYGNICNVSEIERIAKKYDLKVIYDAAHAFGVQLNNRGIGMLGDASIFSFHATKVFNTIEGGAASFRDGSLEEALYSLKNFGIKSEVLIDGIGSNAKMSEFQAAMGLCNLKNIDEEINRRKHIIKRYRDQLSSIEGLKLIEEKNNIKYNYSYFPVVFDEKLFKFSRNEINERLNKCNIYPRKYFYPLISDLNCYKDQYNSNYTPVAQYISKRVLTLPVFGELPLEEVDRICEIIIGK